MSESAQTPRLLSARPLAWLAVLLVLLASWLLPPQFAARGRALLLNLGPNDAEYASGLRDDWERDGATVFHWTGVRARVALPVLLEGSGHRLRLRARRHFLEPAKVKLVVEGRVVGEFELSARSSRVPGQPYVVQEVPLPPLDGRHPFLLEIEAPSENPRPLGLALDWIELERTGEARFGILSRTRVEMLLAIAALLALLVAAGSRADVAAAVSALLLAAMTYGAYADLLALERILRLGLPCFVTTGMLALLLARLLHRPRAGRCGSTAVLVGLVLLALAIRLTLLLHPQFFYPDVRVHALFARELAKGGIRSFLDEFVANQYRFSLGLQHEQGHWYAFPYPPLFYALAWPLIRFARYAPETAVALIPAALNSLEVLVVYALARRLGGGEARALAAAAALPLLPIFLVRLSLAYFPALVGHFVDSLLLCFLVHAWKRMGAWRTWLGLALLLALALLTYTQALLNFGWILPAFLALEVWRDRTSEGRRRQLGLLLAGLLGVVLSLGFYGRYVRFLHDMRHGVAMPEERILLEKQARAPQQPPEPADDPFAGASLDLTRGLAKAGWRMYVFYGWFAPLIVAGVLLSFRGLAPDHQRLMLAWASVYLVLNLASGGLPGPNLVRYNKDLEVVAPIVCLGLAAIWDAARRLRCGLGVLLAASYGFLAARRGLSALSERFFVDRSSGL